MVVWTPLSMRTLRFLGRTVLRHDHRQPRLLEGQLVLQFARTLDAQMANTPRRCPAEDRSRSERSSLASAYLGVKNR